MSVRGGDDMSFIEININNSFNKENDHVQKKGSVSSDSTLGNDNSSHRVEVNSINATSLTNPVANGQLNVVGSNKRETMVREIFIAASGTIIGSIFTYFIVDFFK